MHVYHECPNCGEQTQGKEIGKKLPQTHSIQWFGLRFKPPILIPAVFGAMCAASRDFAAIGLPSITPVEDEATFGVADHPMILVMGEMRLAVVPLWFDGNFSTPNSEFVHRVYGQETRYDRVSFFSAKFSFY
jgi:hypothetical protein